MIASLLALSLASLNSTKSMGPVLAIGVAIAVASMMTLLPALLVAMIDRMKAEQARAAEENQSLSWEVESLRSRLDASEGLVSELSTLKEERDIIRSRVGEMLDQLEALNL